MKLEDISEGLHVRYVAYEDDKAERVEGHGIVTLLQSGHPFPVTVRDDETGELLLLLASEVKEVSP